MEGFIVGKYFGTDGVRGVAGVDLTCELAMKIGRGAAAVLTECDGHRPRILIGKDTRQSGDMLEAALTAGLCSVGADVESLGVLPTPAVAYLVRKYNADAGIVISASHNPMEFNGIKIFAGTGYKLPDDVEARIEAHIDNDCKDIPLATGENIGKASIRSDGLDDYVDYLYDAVHGDLTGLNVCIDCANGASAAVAQKLFPRLGAKCTFIGIEPNGTNINKGVGSTHLDHLEKVVVEGNYDCGIAFDGDADRCLACDEQGKEIDGDKIIALLSVMMKEKGRLDGDCAVVTVMSNLGFIKYMESQGIRTEKTAVGDRYVLENMRENGYAIGGEQSGHVILLHHATTGDGELTAGKLLKMLAESGKKMSELNSVYAQFPQVLINVVADSAQKTAFKEDEVLAGFIENEQQKLMGMGRVLVRVSGTEPKIRVMVEGQDKAAIELCARRIVNQIEHRILKK
jgi:phosphoglucosamine mutase